MALPTHRALIRTHHITSRKKVSVIKDAAERLGCWVLVRSGGVPGVMFAEGSEEGVGAWVGVVHALRYKDYQLVAKPAPIAAEKEGTSTGSKDQDGKWEAILGKFEEVATVKEFRKRMEEKGTVGWWSGAMGYRRK